MQELLIQMLEKAKTDKKSLRFLKTSAVNLQLFELAAGLREMEKDFFPETEEVKKAKERAKEINLIFRMVELNVSEEICWLIDEVIRLHTKKKGKLSMDEAIKLVAKKDELFNDE